MLSGLTLVETVGSKNESELDEMFVWWMIEDLLIVLTSKLLSLSLEILFYIPVTFFFFTFSSVKERFIHMESIKRKIMVSLATRSLCID